MSNSLPPLPPNDGQFQFPIWKWFNDLRTRFAELAARVTKLEDEPDPVVEEDAAPVIENTLKLVQLIRIDQEGSFNNSTTAVKHVEVTGLEAEPGDIVRFDLDLFEYTAFCDIALAQLLQPYAPAALAFEGKGTNGGAFDIELFLDSSFNYTAGNIDWNGSWGAGTPEANNLPQDDGSGSWPGLESIMTLNRRTTGAAAGMVFAWEVPDANPHDYQIYLRSTDTAAFRKEARVVWHGWARVYRPA